MTVATMGVVWAALSVLVYVLLALVLVGIGAGVPIAMGLLVFQRARDEGLANPVAVGFGAGFFTFLVGLFLGGVVLVYVGG